MVYNTRMNKIDFLAVGDITTDAFIRLKDASVNCDINREHCQLCVRFGDKIPYESVTVVRAVGNAPNASVAAARLGLSSALVSNLGADENGRECLAVLAREKVSDEFVAVHKNAATNYHYVLWYEAERTILIKHEHYEYRFPDIGAPRWLYLSSLGGGTDSYHDEITNHLEQHSEIKLAFQPGTFQLGLGTKRLERLYKRCEVFIANKEEVKKLLDLNNEHEPKVLLQKMHALGPRQVLITDGPRGAYFSDGADFFFMPPYPDPKPPYERTGAGDAYASTFVSALALGESAEEALKWAGVNAMAVVQEIGAQKGLLIRAELQDFLARAPKDYQPVKL